MKDTIKIMGYSVGDSSVGIPIREFLINTGLLELNKEDRKFIEATLIRNIWELHDNGDLRWGFSDEPEDYDYRWIMDSKRSNEILEEDYKMLKEKFGG